MVLYTWPKIVQRSKEGIVFFRNKTPDFERISFEEAVQYFSDNGFAVGKPGTIHTQEQLNDVIQGYRSSHWNGDYHTNRMLRETKLYLMFQGLDEYDIRPTATEMLSTHHYMERRTLANRLLLWRTKLSVWIEVALRLFRHR